MSAIKIRATPSGSLLLPIASLTPEIFAAALSEIEPIKENPLDALAARLKERLPALF